MSTIRLELRKDLVNKKGKAPLRLLYQIHGQRAIYAPGIILHPANWDSDSQEVIFLTRSDAKREYRGMDFDVHFFDKNEVDTVNVKINLLKEEIKAIEAGYERAGEQYDVEMIVSKLNDTKKPKTKKQEPNQLLFDFMDQYINDHQSTRVKGSLTVYKSVKKHLEDYQTTTRDRVRFENINYSFFQRFQTFLITYTKLNNISIAKALSTLKTFLSYARKQGIKMDGGYKDFVIKREKLEVVALTQDEFQSLLDIDLSKNKKLDQVRDVFCFSCATGLRYGDIKQLTWANITADEIKIVVNKTRNELIIPLNGISSEILFKYKDNFKPLPVISSQNTNVYIKELCKLANIDTPIKIVRFKGTQRVEMVYAKYNLIHIHTGRKTFCTLSLERGMSAEQVMSISGHSDYKSFKRYVDVTEKLKKVVMKKAWGEIKLRKVI